MKNNKHSIISRYLYKICFKYNLLFLLFLAFIFRFLLSYFYPYIIFPDQVFQTLEPAHRMVFGSGYVFRDTFYPWEFLVGIRSFVYPFFLAVIIKICTLFSDSSRFYMSAIYAVMICFSLIPVYVTYKLIEHKFSRKEAFLGALIPTCFYVLIFYSFATLNGMIPGYLFLYNIYLIIGYLKSLEENNSINKKKLLLIGAIFGLITALRFHLLPEICFAMLYCCRKDFKRSFKYILLGYLLSLMVFGGVVDFLTLGYPFQSIYKNLYINIFLGEAAHFGVSPFYSYITALWSWYGGSVFIVFCIFSYFGWRKYPLIMWIGLINLISFSCISHKEFRFIFLFNICFVVSASFGVA